MQGRREEFHASHQGDPRTATAYAESVAPLILIAHDAAEGGGHAALLPAPTVARLLLGGGLAWLPLLGVLLSAGLYLWAVQRLHRRGYAWSPWRTASWLLGVAVIAYAVLGGIAVLTGTGSVFTQQGLFFSGAAVVTFGGAYAVLAYVAPRDPGTADLQFTPAVRASRSAPGRVLLTDATPEYQGCRPCVWTRVLPRGFVCSPP